MPRLRPLPFLPLLLAAACAAGAAAPPAPPAEEASVKPGINDAFLAEDADVAPWVARFENSERREIARCRDEIVAALGILPGTDLADVGAGTGLFLEPFVAAVGPEGSVAAVDISPAMVAHMDERIRAHGWTNARTVLCDAKSVGLADGSVDLVFICDTYHHFEYPLHTMASIFRALRPGGRVAIVEFRRDPDNAWVLDHVRCSQEDVVAELERSGFRFRGEVPVPGLEDNYLVLFERP
ncbi:MAG: methyltransferase domain-containing protein [Planctomycetota bacterium]|nr:MAG: methyltransferase domain-containing protein [Planctomycetota bacterium]